MFVHPKEAGTRAERMISSACFQHAYEISIHSGRRRSAHVFHFHQFRCQLEMERYEESVQDQRRGRYHKSRPREAHLKRGPIGMQIHAAVGIFDHKDIRIEADPKLDKLITVKGDRSELRSTVFSVLCLEVGERPESAGVLIT